MNPAGMSLVTYYAGDPCPRKHGSHSARPGSASKSLLHACSSPILALKIGSRMPAMLRFMQGASPRLGNIATLEAANLAKRRYCSKSLQTRQIYARLSSHARTWITPTARGWRLCTAAAAARAGLKRRAPPAGSCNALREKMHRPQQSRPAAHGRRAARPRRLSSLGPAGL